MTEREILSNNLCKPILSKWPQINSRFLKKSKGGLKSVHIQLGKIILVHPKGEMIILNVYLQYCNKNIGVLYWSQCKVITLNFLCFFS